MNQQRWARVLVVMALGGVGYLVADQAAAIDRLYIGTARFAGSPPPFDITAVTALDGLVRANTGLGDPIGDAVVVNRRDTGLQVPHSIAVGNEDSWWGLQVVMGSKTGHTFVYHGDLAGPTFVQGGGPITIRHAVGDIGPLQNVIALTHNFAHDDPDGTPNPYGGVSVLYFEFVPDPTTPSGAALNFRNNGAVFGGGDSTSMIIGEFDPAHQGNELLVSTTSLSASLAANRRRKASGHVVAFPGPPAPGGFMNPLPGWPFAVNNTISDMAAGDLVPGGTLEYVITGNSPNDANSVDGQFGKSSQAFEVISNPLWGDQLGLPDQAATPMLAAAIGDLRSDVAGLETVVAGNDLFRILDASGNLLQEIDTNQDIRDLVLADVLGNDGVKEIVVGTFSGLLLAYEHTTPGNGATSFGLDTINFAYGGIFDMKGPVTAMASNVPEPASWLIAVIALAVVGGTRCGSAWRNE